MREPRPRRRPYSRVDRVNEAVREVVAEDLGRIDDDRLALVTVTGVRIDPDLSHGVVFFSSLSAASPPEEVSAVLGEHRVRLQAAIGRELRLKRTPELTFQPDPAIAVGSRVEEILRDLGIEQSSEGSGDTPSGTATAGESGSSPVGEDD